MYEGIEEVHIHITITKILRRLDGSLLKSQIQFLKPQRYLIKILNLRNKILELSGQRNRLSLVCPGPCTLVKDLDGDHIGQVLL